MQYRETRDIKVLQVSCNDRDRFLPPTPEAIKKMKESLGTTGQISPIGVYPITRGSYRVIFGATRFRAASALNWEKIRAQIFLGSDADFKIHELAENLERRELKQTQRREMRKLIKELQRKQLADVAPCKGGRGKKGGFSEAARQAGISERTARRRQSESEKPRQNLESAEVSDAAPADSATPARPPSSDFGKHKVTSDLVLADYRWLDAWCESQNINISEGVRRAVRLLRHSEQKSRAA